MNPLAALSDALREHLAVSQELLAVVEREHQALHQAAHFSTAEFAEAIQRLLPQLNLIKSRLQSHRTECAGRFSDELASHPELTALLRQNQDVIMKILMLDKENEKALLRRGLISASQTPSATVRRADLQSVL